MCGITGILSLNGSKVCRQTLHAMNLAVSHRGPDGSGEYFNSDDSYGTAHRRLSILDLSKNSSQPFKSDDGRYILTYNGEIFNYLELRHELQQLGREFKTESDTEVLLKCYLQWGAQCPEKFNGMWAFTIWDNAKKILFASRDHFGIKPFYFLHEPNKRFVFASETNQFKHLNDFNRTGKRENIINAIRNPFSLEGNGLTIFQGIQSLPAGHNLTIECEGKMRISRWWNTLDYSSLTPVSYSEQVEQFRDLAYDACRLRLRSDVDIATALSGGLDSSSVFSIVQGIKNSRAPIQGAPSSFHKAFIASFPGTAQDETHFAKEVVEKFDAEAIIFEQNYNTLASNVISTTKQFDAIYSTPIIVASDIYRNMRDNGITVSLDGHGVDEMMFGYAGLQLEAAKDALRAGNHAVAKDYIEIYNQLFEENQHKSIETLFPDVIKADAFSKLSRKIEGIWKYRILRQQWMPLQNPPIQLRRFKELTELKNKSEKSLYLQFHHNMLPTILRNFDKASMMHGIESRAPFMDHRIVSFMFRLPLEAKLGGGYTKKILRDSMEGILPETIRTRKLKTGLNAPIQTWLEGPLKEFVLDTVSSSAFKSSNCWNGHRVAKDVKSHFKTHSKTKNIQWQTLWSIINAQIILND